MGMMRLLKQGTGGVGTPASEGAQTVEEPIAAEERLVTGLARVRAKFAMDPADAEQALADAWTPPTAGKEEDESEFVDAVADCLGAGLPLEAALICWDTGELAYEADTDDDESPIPIESEARHTPTTGRRFVVR